MTQDRVELDMMDHCGDCVNWLFDGCLLDGPGDSPDDEACGDFEREEEP
jgi:hypothetical protein